MDGTRFIHQRELRSNRFLPPPPFGLSSCALRSVSKALPSLRIRHPGLHAERQRLSAFDTILRIYSGRTVAGTSTVHASQPRQYI